jgi:peptide/nickel transport system ATP-binding protein
LRSVGIAEPERRLGQYPHELSGGMRQRVMIAIALACGPQILLADEPTTALDVTVQKQILDLLDRQRADRKMGIILVTHDLGVVANHSDDVAVMYAGRVVERAPTSRLFTSVKMPYTEALFRAIPRLADPSRTAPPVLTGRPPDPANLPAGCSFAPRCPYARERCHHEAPPLVAQPEDPKHFVACWYPVDVKAPRAASVARQRVANSPAAGVASAGPGAQPR